MDLRLRNNDVAGPFLEKPSGLRFLCPGSLSLLAHRSLADMLARRSAIPAKSFLSSKIHSFLTGCLANLVGQPQDRPVGRSFGQGSGRFGGFAAESKGLRCGLEGPVVPAKSGGHRRGRLVESEYRGSL